ncbi:cation:proton antiporter [Allokutzneria oryzae]|uniref:Cation:proton antiporter n=1 Tax=Allokutzneria oryzae TaxID=1378989 RepID=A0ABV5ZQH1_9PSEU
MTLLNGVHLIALLGVLYLVAAAGRAVAKLLRLPSVIGEIALSLLLGPVLLAAAGPEVFAAVLPKDLTGVLHEVGDAGLVLFLVGIVYHLDHGSGGLRGRTVRRITAGSFLLPLVTGMVFAGWVVWLAPEELRGSASPPALVLMLAVAMSVTAVPVLARIIEDRDADLGGAGTLAMMASMLIDTLAWLLLAVALGLAAGGIGGVVGAFVAIAVGGVLAYAGHRGLSARRAGTFCASNLRTTALVVGVLALAAGAGARWAGLTAIFGAFLVGMMIPKGGGWPSVVTLVSRIGRGLVPVFFVVAGVTLSTGGLGGMPWGAALLATGLAVVGKIGGGYLGARWAGEDRVTGLRVGVLVNTRGLTEIVVLQVGYTAGLLTPGLFVALLVMALTTTALTGPLLDLIDHRAARAKPLARQGGAL